MPESAAITAARAEVALWESARSAILTGAQSYTVGGRSLTRADLAIVVAELARARRELSRLLAGSAGGPSLMRTMPRDY